MRSCRRESQLTLPGPVQGNSLTQLLKVQVVRLPTRQDSLVDYGRVVHVRDGLVRRPLVRRSGPFPCWADRRLGEAAGQRQLVSWRANDGRSERQRAHENLPFRALAQRFGVSAWTAHRLCAGLHSPLAESIASHNSRDASQSERQIQHSNIDHIHNLSWRQTRPESV